MLKAMNLIGMYVESPERSATFYNQIGFTVLSTSPDLAEVRLGDIKLDLIANATAKQSGEKFEKEAMSESKGAGLYLNIETTEIDALYQQLIDTGLTPSSQPRDWPWGQREFALRDPDGYKLVFYEKIVAKER